MFRVHTPEQPTVPPMPNLAAEFDRLYLEKCQEVNRLEQEVDKYKNMVEIAVKQKGELRAQMDGQKALLEELRQQLEEAKQTIRELAAEQLPFGFIPDVEEPEEIPEELLEELPEELFVELPLWRLQPTTSQDILCLSSALKNLHDIHKCDSFVLYTKLSRVLEKCIDQYSGED